MKRPFCLVRLTCAWFMTLCLLYLTAASPYAYAQHHRPRVVEEAREFMRDYAGELRAGKRAAISARYDRSGAYLLRAGTKKFVAYDSIVARYAGPSWSPPVSFEWQDLSFEALGPDAAAVVGTFTWVAAIDKPPVIASYSAVLRRQNGRLRIRVEDECAVPAPTRL